VATREKAVRIAQNRARDETRADSAETDAAEWRRTIADRIAGTN
jgi:hypothetical protein